MSVYPPSTPPSPRPRDRTRLWAALAFMLLSVACLTVVALAFSGGQLPDLGGAELSWTPPPDQAPAVVDAAPPPAAGQRFAPGDTVLNVNPGPVNLRQSPGFQNKPASDVITAIPAGQAGVIAGGPVEADGLVWWQVRFGERTGWMAERSSSGVTLLDRTP
ncbi:MAG: hypothetical protein WA040_08220 [Anaerolineae bacterium]